MPACRTNDLLAGSLTHCLTHCLTHSLTYLPTYFLLASQEREASIDALERVRMEHDAEQQVRNKQSGGSQGGKQQVQSGKEVAACASLAAWLTT